MAEGSFAIVTWLCPRCHTKQFTKAGSKWVQYKGRRRQICPSCVAERNAKRIGQATENRS